MFILFSLLTLVNSLSKFTYTSCGSGSDIAQNVVLFVSPEIVTKDYTLYLDADLSKEITGGISKYSVTYNFIPLAPSENDLCSEILNSNISCPLSNHIASESKGTIPDNLTGTTVIKNEWFNENQERILCISFTIKAR